MDASRLSISGITPDSNAVGSPVVRFESAEEFRREFRENIADGAIFIPTADAFETRQVVSVIFDLDFCGKESALPAEIVAIVDPALAELTGSQAGISVRFTQSNAETRSQLARVSGVILDEPSEASRLSRRAAPRSDTRANIVVKTADQEYKGETANLSYSGVLALLPMTSIPLGSEVCLHLSNPLVELDLDVDGKIVHCQRCDGGVVAHGIQLFYSVDRIEEVTAFIEFLQSFDRARRLATVSGDFAEAGLASVLDMFASTAPSGTVVVSRGDDIGKVVFSDSYLLHASVGMTKGMKALARMVCWPEGHFEFHHELQLPENPDEPKHLEAAMMMASVQMDEMARIGLDTFGPNETFVVRKDRAALHRNALTELEREIFDYVADGFNVAAIVDIVSAPDAEAFKALVVLVDVGIVERISQQPAR